MIENRLSLNQNNQDLEVNCCKSLDEVNTKRKVYKTFFVTQAQARNFFFLSAKMTTTLHGAPPTMVFLF
jgi:hypothetical protein